MYLPSILLLEILDSNVGNVDPVACIALLLDFIQTTRRFRSGFTSTLPHLGAFGLFLLAILDSSPVPTFGGTDILTAILAARHREPWYYYAAAATAGSVIGAYVTFRFARQAGSAYWHKFRRGGAVGLWRCFEKWGTGALIVFTAVPLPFPTSAFFAAAGASEYPVRRYMALVSLSRSVRYAVIAVIADHYGRHVITVLRHPDRYWAWLLLAAAVAAGGVAIGMHLNRRLDAASRPE